MSTMELSSEKWIISIWPLILHEIKIQQTEREIITKLTQNKEIFLKLEEKVQKIIQHGIENPRRISCGDNVISGIYYELFGLQFNASLRIYEHSHGMNGLMTVWKTMPMIQTKQLYIKFNAYTSSSRKDIMVIDNTKQLLKACTKGAEKLVYYYCRTKIEKKKNIFIPIALKHCIVKYITINLATFKNWTKKK